MSIVPSAEIEEAHLAARAAGRATYRDPATGYTVMCEHALRNRMTCCGNGCRHCPYGYTNVAREYRASYDCRIRLPFLMQARDQVKKTKKGAHIAISDMVALRIHRWSTDKPASDAAVLMIVSDFDTGLVIDESGTASTLHVTDALSIANEKAAVLVVPTTPFVSTSSGREGVVVVGRHNCSILSALYPLLRKTGQKSVDVITLVSSTVLNVPTLSARHIEEDGDHSLEDGSSRGIDHEVTTFDEAFLAAAGLLIVDRGTISQPCY